MVSKQLYESGKSYRHMINRDKTKVMVVGNDAKVDLKINIIISNN
jgi:hypothetical protein